MDGLIKRVKLIRVNTNIGQQGGKTRPSRNPNRRKEDTRQADCDG